MVHVLNRDEDFTTTFGEFGGPIKTHTVTTVVETNEDLLDAVNTARPLYLKHAHPRNGKIRETVSGESHTFSFDYTNEDGETYVYHRIYRTETPEEESVRLYEMVESAI